MSAPLSMDGAIQLTEFLKARDACDPAINSRAKLEREIKRVLIYSVAMQSSRFTDGAADYERVQMRAMEEYNSNPVFHSFINKQCMELMRVFSRVEPGVV